LHSSNLSLSSVNVRSNKEFACSNPWLEAAHPNNVVLSLILKLNRLSITTWTRGGWALCGAVSQVSSRIISFVFNVLVARRLTQEQFGLQAVQFHLFTTTILFISREGFRRGCLRGHVGILRGREQLQSIGSGMANIAMGSHLFTDIIQLCDVVARP
jgi:hypothetical protein